MVTIDGQGNATHEANCVTEQNKKHRNALEKIGHILKEVGIGIVETAVDVVFKNTGMGGDS